MTQQSIIIIDDDPIVVQSLETILSRVTHLHVVATGHSGQDAIRLYEAHTPDVVLMDIRMMPMLGIDAAQEILSRWPQANILFITTFQDDDYITKAIAMGCKGYILKQNIRGLVPAIEAVTSGNLVFDSEIVHTIVATPAPTHRPLAQLNDRENELLYLVAEGYNNKEIAEKLFLSEGTVRNYLSQLLEKCDVRDRTQLAIYYYKNQQAH